MEVESIMVRSIMFLDDYVIRGARQEVRISGWQVRYRPAIIYMQYGAVIF